MALRAAVLRLAVSLLAAAADIVSVYGHQWAAVALRPQRSSFTENRAVSLNPQTFALGVRAAPV